MKIQSSLFIYYTMKQILKTKKYRNKLKGIKTNMYLTYCKVHLHKNNIGFI